MNSSVQTAAGFADSVAHWTSKLFSERKKRKGWKVILICLNCCQDVPPGLLQSTSTKVQFCMYSAAELCLVSTGSSPLACRREWRRQQSQECHQTGPSAIILPVFSAGIFPFRLHLQPPLASCITTVLQLDGTLSLLHHICTKGGVTLLLWLGDSVEINVTEPILGECWN